MGSILTLAVIAVLAFFALRTIRRKRLLFSCGGDCSRCAQRCASRQDGGDPPP